MEFGVSNSKMVYNEKKNSAGSIFYMFLFFMFVLIPTSTNGNLPQLTQIIIDWAILTVTILICMIFFSRINWNQLLIAFFVMVAMLLITIMSNYYNPYGKFSLARVAPILCFFAMSVVSIRTVIPIKLVKFMLHLFMCIFTIWNFLIIIDDSTIQIFTISNYTQLYEEATSNMFIKRRPVMSFGIYTFASYFYFVFFLISRSLLKLTGNKIYLLYLILILIANVLLVSNTAFIFSFLMAYFIFNSFSSKNSKIIFVLFITVAIFYVISTLNLTEYYLESFNSDTNGFKGRYTDSGTLNLNLDYLENNFFIGFNIIDGLTYSDSGYIVYYTMGGIILLISMFYCFYKFSKNNFSKNYLLFLIPTMIFEIALPVMTYYKFIYAALFFAFCFKSIDFHAKINSEQ